jgi:polyhydroxyalkanoate synthesis regulator phasin
LSSPSSPSERGPFQTLTLAGFGALALAARRADDLADELASSLGVERDEMRQALADALEGWRREARRLGDSTSDAAWRLAEDLGVATQESLRDLELRVAQLEHRLRLLERGD